MKKGYEIGLPLMSFSVHCYICNFKLLLKILFEINYFWIIFYKMRNKITNTNDKNNETCTPCD